MANPIKSIEITLAVYMGQDISMNNQNLKYIIRDIFYLLLYFVLTNYEAIPLIIGVGLPIWKEKSAPRNSNPGLELLADRWFFRFQHFETLKSPKFTK